MTKVTIAIKNSVVMLFSFALIATILTVGNVGVNESGTAALSTVQTAEAFEIGYDLGGISPPAVKPSEACKSACSLPKKTGDAGKGTYGGNFNPNVKSIYYGCSSVNSAGVCNVNSVIETDSKIHQTYCTYRLSNRGYDVAFSGPAAVQYLKSRLIGTIWAPWGSSERMFRHLTGRDLGWFPYPIGWSNVNSIYYNGTTAAQYEGALNFYCKTNVRVNQVYKTTTVTCPPKNDGRPFPYSVGYVRSYSNSNNANINVINAVYGGSQGYTGTLQNRNWTTTAVSCVYVNPSTPPPKTLERTDTCYWNLSHRGYFSQNKAAILSGGTLTTNQPRYKGAPTYAPWISGDNSTAVLQNCTPSLSMSVSLSLTDGYAYYRLQGSANARAFQTYTWDRSYTNGQRRVADIVAGPITTQTLKAFGTHACTSPAYRGYSSWGALPNINFSYANCGRNTTWECNIPHNPRINGVGNAVEVMRDGSYIRTDLGGVSITGNGVRDAFSKQVGAIADKNLSYMVKVENGSSPLDGTNPNSTKQYFELWKSDKATETVWNTWLPQPNTNKTSYLTYYWSSDNGSVWRMNYQAKINTGEFAVPFQDATDSPSGTRWKTETNVDCDGVKVSNSATVLRSVTSEG